MSRGRMSPFPMCVCALLCTIALTAQTVPDSESFTDPDEHFKYGSIGTEERVGLPYWIWKVLPLSLIHI